MLSYRRLTLVLAFTLAAQLPRNAIAQVERTLSIAQVEHPLSVDVAVGGANVKGGEFFDNSLATARLSASKGLLQRGRLVMFAEGGYDWLFRLGPLGNPDVTCVRDTAGGGCAPDFPDVQGPSMSIGLRYAPVSRVETRVSVGGAAYSVGGTRVGAAVGQLDAAVFPAANLGLFLGARYAAVRYRQDRLTLVPLLLGLRVR